MIIYFVSFILSVLYIFCRVMDLWGNESTCYNGVSCFTIKYTNGLNGSMKF